MQQFNRHRLFVAWRQLIFNRNHSESQIIVFCLRRSKSRTSSGLYLFGSGLWRTVIELLPSIILIVFSFLLSFLKFQNVCACSQCKSANNTFCHVWCVHLRKLVRTYFRIVFGTVPISERSNPPWNNFRNSVPKSEHRAEIGTFKT